MISDYFMSGLFLASGSAFLYILAGYPALLSYLACVNARPVNKVPFFPTVTIIIPVMNGKDFIAEKLESIAALDYPWGLVDIIVVSDGSTDATNQIAHDLEKTSRSKFKLIILSESAGKPTALNTALVRATGEIVVLTDVRQPLHPDSVRVLMKCFADPSVGVASGEIIFKKSMNQESVDIGLYWKLETNIRNWLGSIDSIFGANGQFYAMRRSLVVPIPKDILLDDMYLPLAAFRLGYRLIVEPGAVAYDFPMSRATEFKRKVRTLAGNYQLLATYPWLLGPQNRLWFHFYSYKFGRLLLPWLMLTIAISTFWLALPWKILFIPLQVAFYGLAAFDPVIKESSKLKKVSSPARTFCVMMVAVVRGLQVFFVPARSLWTVTSVTKDL